MPRMISEKNSPYRSGSSTPIVCVSPVLRLRAALSGTYRSRSATPRMRSRVASETLPCPLITRDTVAVDTCASRATSLRVTPIPSPGQRASVYIQHGSACLNASRSVLLQPGLSRNGPARRAVARVMLRLRIEPLAMRGAICCGAIRHARSPVGRWPGTDGRSIVMAMILGMSTAAFTLLHVVISLIAIACGVVVAIGLWRAQRLPGWTAVFLVTTIATSVTGFLFHSKSFGAPHVVGVISLVILAIALIAFYGYRLAGAWRWIYVAGALAAFYLNVFVAVVQAFQKLPFLRALAPTGSEPPFAVAQLLVLAGFIALGIIAARRFHPSEPAPAQG